MQTPCRNKNLEKQRRFFNVVSTVAWGLHWWLEGRSNNQVRIEVPIESLVCVIWSANLLTGMTPFVCVGFWLRTNLWEEFHICNGSSCWPSGPCWPAQARFGALPELPHRSTAAGICVPSQTLAYNFIFCFPVNWMSWPNLWRWSTLELVSLQLMIFESGIFTHLDGLQEHPKSDIKKKRQEKSTICTLLTSVDPNKLR